MAIESFGLYPRLGTSAGLKTLKYVKGQFICTTDNKKIYIDAPNGNRILIAEAKSNLDLITGTFIQSEWQYQDSSDTWVQTVQNENVSGNYPLIIDLVVTLDSELGATEQDEWSKITRIVTEYGKIIAYCYGNQPNVDLNFQAKEV